MKEIKLYNRDGADLKLVNRENSDLWDLTVDSKHQYCLKYMRCGGDFDIKEESGKQIINWKSRKMVDPSGGPYLEVGDSLEHGKYKIIEIVDDTVLRLSKNEGNNN